MKEQKTDNFFKYWLPTILAVLTVSAYVWSSATKFQEITSGYKENEKNLEKLEVRVESRLIRIENKQDIILSKLR